MEEANKSLLNEQSSGGLYDQVVKLIEENPDKARQWVEETGDDNMIYMLVDNVKYNKDMTKNADYYDERLKEDEDNTNDFIKYMGTGDDIHLGGFPGKNIMEESNKVLLGEAYEGIIQDGDDVCEIKCKRKIAKNGSTGVVVKDIQHYLAKGAKGYGPYNPTKGGGGMESRCKDKSQYCDGKFRGETQKAVQDFQKDAKIKVDGVVGAETLKKICELLDAGGLCYSKCDCDEKTQTKNVNKTDKGVGGKSTNDFLKGIDCDELKICLSRLFGKKDVINRSDILKCIGGGKSSGKGNSTSIGTEYSNNTNLEKGDKPGQESIGWDPDWSCDDCPNGVNLMPMIGDKERPFKQWCVNNCGTKASY